MRRPLIALAGLVLAAGALAGCGDDTGTTASDPGPTATSSPASEPPSGTPTEAAVSVRKTCAELYHPPAQLMPRAIEYVHGSPSAEGSAEAEQLVTALAGVEGHSLGPLAEDIAVVREAVDARRAAAGSGGSGLKSFDAATHRLAGHCEFYND